MPSWAAQRYTPATPRAVAVRLFLLWLTAPPHAAQRLWPAAAAASYLGRFGPAGGGHLAAAPAEGIASCAALDGRMLTNPDAVALPWLLRDPASGRHYWPRTLLDPTRAARPARGRRGQPQAPLCKYYARVIFRT